MINVAIVEDERPAAELLAGFLEKYSGQYGEQFKTVCFADAITFLTNYQPNYDLVFMDIELPDLNGMDAAKKMRGLDKDVTLIFVTNMAQFAVKGYEVGAYDFIVKPVMYPNFALKLRRALEYIRGKSGVKLHIPVDNGVMCLPSSEIKYVEIIKHRIIYHTLSGDYNSHGTLKKVEALLPDAHFVRCNSCYLVNLRFVTAVIDYQAHIGGEVLQISHPKKREFMRALNNYFGGGV